MKNINKYIDHTILKPNTCSTDVEKICQEAIKYEFASACIPPSFVGITSELLSESNVEVCTVIGFPLGYSSTQAKMKESEIALEQGCKELDMVINLTHLFDKKYSLIEKEISQLAELAHSDNALLKVIIETCLLSDQQKIDCCKIVSNAGADYIKTSTGFSTGGAAVEDVILFKGNIGERIKIKASGGIKTAEFAMELIKAGASRIGTSSGVRIVEECK
jgi:deoxyribose-phosphate aldolase